LAPTPASSRRDGDLLSEALKRVRRRRGMTAARTAAAMGMPLRTYERFEAGEGRLNIDHVHRFAAATDSDPHAIVMAVAIGSPALAARCADNKLVTALTIAARRFDAVMGDRIADLEVRTVIMAVCAMFDELVDHADQQETLQQWTDRGMDELSSVRPRPGR
jgi:transcriptional regulator with XRE-family HTH domain